MEKGQPPNAAPPAYQPLQNDPASFSVQQPGYAAQGQPPAPGYAQQPGYGPPPQQHCGSYAPPQPMMHTSQQSNTTVVMQQPQTQVVANVMFPPHDYMGLSIFSCLCCFWPVGLIAIIFSSQVHGLYAAGNYGAAASTALRARNCAYIAIILGICGIILGGIVMGIAANSTPTQ